MGYRDVLLRAMAEELRSVEASIKILEVRLEMHTCQRATLETLYAVASNLPDDGDDPEA